MYESFHFLKPLFYPLFILLTVYSMHEFRSLLPSCILAVLQKYSFFWNIVLHFGMWNCHQYSNCIQEPAHREDMSLTLEVPNTLKIYEHPYTYLSPSPVQMTGCVCQSSKKQRQGSLKRMMIQVKNCVRVQNDCSFSSSRSSKLT